MKKTPKPSKEEYIPDDEEIVEINRQIKEDNEQFAKSLWDDNYEEKQSLLEGEIVYKSNSLARAAWRPDTIWQMRIIAILISKIHVYDDEFSVIKIPISEILEQDYDGGKQRKDFIVSIRQLAKRTAEFFNHDEKTFTIKPFFALLKIKFETNEVIAEFNKKMMPELLQLRERFCKQDLFLWTSITSTHTLQLYDLLSSWCYKNSFEISIENLHKKMNTPKSAITNFAEFRRNFLNPAQRTLAGSDVSFSYTVEKVGRKIGKVKFFFKKQFKNTKPERLAGTAAIGG